MRTVLSIFALFFLPETLWGQPLNAPLRFTNYSIAEGLPSNVVGNFMQDSRGFIWLSTAQGLARFDGSRFTVYRHSHTDSNSMPYEGAGTCIELKNQHLLFNSRTKMWMLNPFNHQQYAPPEFWKNKNDALLTYMNEHFIGILCGDKTYFTNMDLHVIDSVNTPLQGIVGLRYAGNNRILFFNSHKTVCYSLIERQFEEWKIPDEGFGNTNGYAIQAVDSVNKVLYGVNYFSGFFTISYNPENPYYLLPKPITGIKIGGTRNIIYKEGDLIASGDDKLYVLQKNKPPVIFSNSLSNNNNLPGGGADGMFADNAGNFWVTGHNGVSHFQLNQLNYQYWKLPYAANLEFCTKYAGKIWMRSENHGSIYFDTKLQQLQVIDSSIIGYGWGVLPVNDQMYIHGNGFFGNPRLPANNVKLLAYDLQTKKITAPSFLKPWYHDAELITLIFQSQNGDIWYSLNKGNGIVRQKAITNEFTQYRYTDNPPPFSFRYVNKAAEDATGNIYFSVNKRDEILVWKNKEEHFEEWKPDSLLNIPKISFGPLYHHLIDSKQNLWLCYGSTGLMQYNLITKKGKLFETDDGLPSNVFFNMVADADDNIWMPTAKGLVCLLAATHKFLVFTAQDGLPFTNFFESYLFYDKDDSSLYFGNTGYLYRVKTNELLSKKQQSNASLYIDRMDVNNQPYYFTSTNTIELKSTENNLQFNFTALDLDNTVSSKNYEYSLTKSNDKPIWQKLTGTNVIAFNQLNPGNYYLQVRMLNEATNIYINGSNSFHFTIATPWSKSWWFIALVFATISLIVWQLIKAYYQRRIEKQKAVIEKQLALVNERSRIAADMHDDMGAGLSRMRYLSTAMKNEIKDEGLKEGFDKLISGSDELVDKMNDIIWTLNSGDENLEDTLYYIRSQCSEMLDNAHIIFKYSLPDIIPGKMINSEEKRNLYLAVKEAVHNAIKHSKATQVDLSVQIADQLKISIADNGSGFDTVQNKLKGNGLSNYQKRMAVLKGTVAIQSGEKGTTIKFEVPLV